MEEIQARSRGRKKLVCPVLDTELSSFLRTDRVQVEFEI
jgi:hypothetical protein